MMVAASAHAERPTILIVEDDSGAAEIFRQILDSTGYGVRVAADAPSGLMEIQRETPDAVLVDLHLPGADGVSFLRAIRDDPSCTQLPIAVMTADYLLEETIASQVQALGARVYLKPLWEDELLRLVDELVRRGRLRR